MQDRIELYVNDQHPQINDGVKYIHLTHVQSLDNASCMEIEINDCLDYALERDEILSVIIGKLRYGGVIKINGVDLDEVIYNRSVGILSIPQTQQLLYAGRMSNDTYENVISKFQQSNLTIIQEDLNNNQYFVTAKRELANE